jgi:hypothetical protein
MDSSSAGFENGNQGIARALSAAGVAAAMAAEKAQHDSQVGSESELNGDNRSFSSRRMNEEAEFITPQSSESKTSHLEWLMDDSA